MFYVPPDQHLFGQLQSCETVPIRIRPISSPSNGGRKHLRENYQALAVKGESQTQAAATRTRTPVIEANALEQVSNLKLLSNCDVLDVLSTPRFFKHTSII